MDLMTKHTLRRLKEISKQLDEARYTPSVVHKCSKELAEIHSYLLNKLNEKERSDDDEVL